MLWKKASAEKKGDLLADHLIGGVPEWIQIVIGQLYQYENVRFNEWASQQALIESFAFFLHLIDRMAFKILGASERVIFADRIMTKIAICFTSPELIAQFRNTYNKRQVEYSKYKEIVPSQAATMKGTLAWEFSKILFALSGGTDPTLLVAISVEVSDSIPLMLSKAIKVEEILNS